MSRKIAEWTAERDKVASGLSRVGNQWVSRAEAEREVDLARSRDLLDQGRSLLVQSNFPQALEQFKAVISSSKQSEPVLDAKRLYAETSLLWYDSLAHQQEFLTDEMKLYEDRVDRTLQKRNDADSRLREALRSGSDANASTNESSHGLPVAKLQTDYDHAYAENVDASKHLAGLRKQLNALEQTMTEARSCAVLFAVNSLPSSSQPRQSLASQQPAPAQAPLPSPASPPPPSTPPSTTLAEPQPAPNWIGQIGRLVKRYWIAGVAGLVGVLWVGSRFATRR